MREPTYASIRPRTSRLGRRVVHLARVDSTMDEARRLAEAGAEDGTVVVADEQTAGRGRAGRPWFSARGSLQATLLLRPPLPSELTLLSLGAGLALARSLEKLVKAPARTKWPNDVWIEGKKVAGILIESRIRGSSPEFVLVGLGVNGDVRPNEFPAEIRDEATSLSAWAGRHVCMPALLKVFLEEYERLLGALLAGAAHEVVAAAGERELLLGNQVEAVTPEGRVLGLARRLGPAGELILEVDGRELPVHEGDCRLVRPRRS